MIRRSAVFLFLLLILTEFNNCGNTGKTGFGYTSTLAACDPPDPNLIYDPNAAAPNVDCTLPDTQYLSVSPGGGDQTIQLVQGDFNVGGYCNSGAYTYNTIAWELMLNGVLVRHSGMYDTNGSTFNTTCRNGRFSSKIALYAIGEDPVNRTGLAGTNGVRVPYTLTFIITGYDANGQPYQNQVYGVQTINLTPL